MKPLARVAATVTTAALAAGLGLGAPGHAAPISSIQPSSAADVPATHVVSGTTVRPDGQPVDNISVVATDPLSGEAMASALTYGGGYELHLPAGTWALTYSDLGDRFVDRTDEVTVVDGPVALPQVTLYRPSPSALTAPELSGSPTVGSVLTLRGGEWSAGTREVALTYTWLLDGTPVGDEPTLELLPEHVGHRLTPVVTARAADSLPTEVVLTDVDVAKSPTSVAITRSTGDRSKKGTEVQVVARVSSPTLTPAGTVELVRKGKVVASRKLRNGSGTLVVRGLAGGKHKLVVRYRGSDVAEPSRSRTVKVVVPKR